MFKFFKWNYKTSYFVSLFFQFSKFFSVAMKLHLHILEPAFCLRFFIDHSNNVEEINLLSSAFRESFEIISVWEYTTKIRKIILMKNCLILLIVNCQIFCKFLFMCCRRHKTRFAFLFSVCIGKINKLINGWVDKTERKMR